MKFLNWKKRAESREKTGQKRQEKKRQEKKRQEETSERKAKEGKEKARKICELKDEVRKERDLMRCARVKVRDRVELQKMASI